MMATKEPLGISSFRPFNPNGFSLFLMSSSFNSSTMDSEAPRVVGNLSVALQLAFLGTFRFFVVFLSLGFEAVFPLLSPDSESDFSTFPGASQTKSPSTRTEELRLLSMRYGSRSCSSAERNVEIRLRPTMAEDVLPRITGSKMSGERMICKCKSELIEVHLISETNIKELEGTEDHANIQIVSGEPVCNLYQSRV